MKPFNTIAVPHKDILEGRLLKYMSEVLFKAEDGKR
jgi:hypothetical protein